MISILGLPEFESLEQAHTSLIGLGNEFGIQNMAYLGLRLDPADSTKPIIVSSYQGDWVSRYIAQQYVLLDPAIAEGLKGILPFDWSNARTGDRQLRNFFGEANEFGVQHCGISIPIRGPLGEKAVFSFNSDLPPKEWENFKAEHLSELMVFSFTFHQEVMRITEQSPPGPKHISSRERQILHWASQGKSAWETAKIVGLSENTVAFYLKNLQVKLRASNKPHTIALALRSGLLH